ncbi:Predicted thioesterase [Selenomonas ruminantium]|uniref:Predicted thioesterase n=1 Tax=Selenomonas ruminantium TaxID=971 RepID=A0A1M6T1I3_SELRU|nr:thioesterase family protein [Selenomonas ruminantium]SHK50814.1 Predicted thioesterase [Selenomonas ruminantium]
MELTDVKVGLKNVVTEEVTQEKTAQAMGSGSLPVYATPAMTCLMEKAATEALEPLVPEGWTTVGISLHVAHKAATPVGMQVRAEAEVTAVEGRKIIFTVRAFDDAEEIGVGTHERFAVLKEKFLTKAQAKH